MTRRVQLLGVAGELPHTVRTSAQIEDMVAASGGGFLPRRGIVEAISGIRQRRVASDDMQCSDLAVAACRRVLADANLTTDDVDLLIFASAGQDLIEPATAHIVQAKLGSSCQVFDVKNACNSFLNGLQLAESLIATGACKNALVAVGEINSRAVAWHPKDQQEFRRNLPGYTMGDAGAAALLAPSTDERGIFFRRFYSISDHWNLTTVSSGGSMNPRGDEHTYLRANGARLMQVFKVAGPPSLRDALDETGMTFADFRRIFVHQVSLPYLRDTLAAGAIPADMVEVTITDLGNMAAASIPVAMARAAERGAIGPGDRVLCIGLASGISIGIVMIEL